MQLFILEAFTRVIVHGAADLKETAVANAVLAIRTLALHEQKLEKVGDGGVEVIHEAMQLFPSSELVCACL